MKEKRMNIITEKTDENDKYELKRTNAKSSRGLQEIEYDVNGIKDSAFKTNTHSNKGKYD
jgi:hypothetical protein